jgi:hypothetical protein
MAWQGIVGKSFTADGFEKYVASLKFGAWRPCFIVVHNTSVPDTKTWKGRQARKPPVTDEKWARNLEAFQGPRLARLPASVRHIGRHSGDESVDHGRHTFPYMELHLLGCRNGRRIPLRITWLQRLPFSTPRPVCSCFRTSVGRAVSTSTRKIRTRRTSHARARTSSRRI